MNYQGAIIIVDNDNDDQDIYSEIFEELAYPNKIVQFANPQAVYEYLINTEEPPFLVISEVIFPTMDGFDLKKKILETPGLAAHSIPFVYFTSKKNRETVKVAFDLAAQGYFEKHGSFIELKRTISIIMEYWGRSVTPAKV